MLLRFQGFAADELDGLEVGAGRQREARPRAPQLLRTVPQDLRRGPSPKDVEGEVARLDLLRGKSEKKITSNSSTVVCFSGVQEIVRSLGSERRVNGAECVHRENVSDMIDWRGFVVNLLLQLW